MRNLKKETLAILNEHNKTEEDIKWIGCKSFKIPNHVFWELADKYYDAGYGAEEVMSDILIVGNDWWLERNSYDGAEWWEYKTAPIEPKKTKTVPTLFAKDLDYNIWYFGDLRDLAIEL